MICIEHLGKTYENEILRDINVTINDGDVISIIGPSGCGKSTFLRCINLLERPTTGRVLVDGQDATAAGKRELAQLRQKMGMVFQSFNLFSNMTIIENIMLAPTSLRGVDPQAAYDEGMDLLESVGLGSKSMSYPDMLSGGQRQRAAIARSLAMHPEIMLFDEPTSALDPTSVSEVLGVIRRLAEQGRTMLIVTHEMSFAEHVSNRVFYMDEKGIYEDDKPEVIFHHPQKPRTRDFIYRTRTFSYVINGAEFDFYDLLGKAVDFLKGQLLDEKRIQSVILMCEELIFNLLFKALDKNTLNVNMSIRYMQTMGTIELVFDSPAIRADITDSAVDDISGSIIHKLSKDIRPEAGRLTVTV